MLFLGAVAIHLLALAFGRPTVIAITKVALMPVLWLLGKNAVKSVPTGWTIAILFSWIGDILLLPQWSAEVFFLAGMGAFLIAQLSYCRLLWTKGAQLSVPAILTIIAIVSAVEWGLASTAADITLRIGIGVYGTCLLAMLMLSLSFNKFRKQPKLALTTPIKWGAVLFVLSDGLIALRMFVLPEGYGTQLSIAVMLTYGIAQLGLAWLLLLADKKEK
ncbi:MAG: lysoplasmalogenase family protein [Saprospiraceae bacterium]